MLEKKSTAGKTITVRRDDIEKLEKQAWDANREPVFVLEFETMKFASQQWAMIPLERLLELYEIEKKIGRILDKDIVTWYNKTKRKSGVMSMELKYKVNKIRDLVVFETGIVPVEVDVERHEVIIRIKEVDLEHRGLSVDEVRKALEPVIPRKLRIDVVENR